MPSSVVRSTPPILSAVPDDLFQEEFPGPIRRTHERARGDVGEAHPLAGLAELIELLRGDVLLDREMPFAGSEILAEGHDVDLRLAKVAHGLEDLLAGLPEAEHDRGLREEAVPHPLRPAEDPESLRVVRPPVSDDRLEAFHGLDVVVEDVDACIDDGSHSLEVPLEIRDEGLDQEVGPATFDLPDGLCEVRGAAIREVVPVDRGQDHVGEVHVRKGDRDLAWFVHVEDAVRVAGLHGAEVTPACARVAHKHDRGRPAAPAFPNVRAVGLLADGVEVQRSEEALQMSVILAGRRADPEPFGLPFREHDTLAIVGSAYEPEPPAASRQPNRNSTPYDPRG